MTKRKKIGVILIVIGLVLAIGAGFFYWYINREIKGSPDDYVIEETETGKIVKNERAGLTVRIPEGWIEEKMDIMEGSMVFYSPDMESMRKNSTSPPLKKGCMIEVVVGYKKMTFDEIEEYIKEGHESLVVKSEDIFEIIEVNGIPALKNIFESMELGHLATVYLSVDDILYQISIVSSGQDINQCSQEFDKFLENISIE